MNKSKKVIYYLSTCSTCKRIIAQIENRESFDLHDIKQLPLTEKQIDDMRAYFGTYASIFSRRANLYKELNIGSQLISEEQIKQYLLLHYTFLKRPIVMVGSAFYICSLKAELARLNKKLTDAV